MQRNGKYCCLGSGGIEGNTSAAGAAKVRCGPTTVLQPCLPSHGLCNLSSQRVRSAIHCGIRILCSLTSLAGVRALPVWSSLLLWQGCP